MAPSGHRRWTVVVPRRLTARAAQALADAEAAQSALPPSPEAIRFRAQLTMFGLIGTVASGLYVYSEKHAAASLDRELAHAYQATAAAHQQSSLLRAEWALLNNPDRLHPLIDRYLSLQPLNAAQFAKVADLHSRLPKILYGPPAPVTDEDAGAPPIVTKRLLAMAEMPAQPVPPAEPALEAPAPAAQAAMVDEAADDPATAPEQPARTPVVAGPAHAFRVLAHAGAVPAIVDAAAPEAVPAEDRGEAGVVEDEAPHIPAEARSSGPASQPAWHPMPRLPAPASMQAPGPRLVAARPVAAKLVAAKLVVPRFTAPKFAAPRYVALAEPPKPRPAPQPPMLRPELVHMLMMPHQMYTSTWTAKPQAPAVNQTLPQHHMENVRSDAPHFLGVPQTAPAKPVEPQQYAEARPRILEQPRQDTWTPPATYRSPLPYAYRPYWGGYNANPYGGYYYPAPRQVYPGYQ